MTRIARIVVPGVPHHVTQRGNNRAAIFFEDGDYAVYRDLLKVEAAKARVAVWGWCLMPNHVHLILTPEDEEGLPQALGRAHRRYAGFVNARALRTGHLFQERFASAPMEEDHFAHAVRYVSLNPVRAGLCAAPEDWPWSSARAHLGLCEDGLTDRAPVFSRFPDVRGLLAGAADFGPIRRAEHTGRPIGSPGFVAALEERLQRRIAPLKRGRKPKASAETVSP